MNWTAWIAAAAALDRPEFRASIAGLQIVGLAVARYIVRVPRLPTPIWPTSSRPWADDPALSHRTARIGRWLMASWPPAHVRTP